MAQGDKAVRVSSETYELLKTRAARERRNIRTVVDAILTRALSKT